ncbi:MAG: hypothetical protein IIY73_05165 [Solobacterium sp.]|nr:hypothetical protein [Solobacterium sp.]
MQKTIVNGALRIAYPDTCTVLTPAELKQMYRDDSTDRWSVRNAEEHRTVTVMWKKYAWPAVLMPDNAAIARNNERLMREGLKSYSYALDGFFETELCGQKGCGYDYAYTSQGIAVKVKTVLFRHHSTVWSVSFYWRAAEENPSEMIREMLASMEF